MAQTRTYRKLTSTRLVLSFLVGALIVAVCGYDLIYREPDIIGSRADGGFIGLGVVLMLVPFLRYFRRRRTGTLT